MLSILDPIFKSDKERIAEDFYKANPGPVDQWAAQQEKDAHVTSLSRTLRDRIEVAAAEDLFTKEFFGSISNSDLGAGVFRYVHNAGVNAEAFVKAAGDLLAIEFLIRHSAEILKASSAALDEKKDHYRTFIEKNKVTLKRLNLPTSLD